MVIDGWSCYDAMIGSDHKIPNPERITITNNTHILFRKYQMPTGDVGEKK